MVFFDTDSLTGGHGTGLEANSSSVLFFLMNQNPFGHLWALRFAVLCKF